MIPEFRELPHLTEENRRLLQDHFKAKLDLELKPELGRFHFQRCKTKILIVTDGFLGFGPDGFGLMTFVRALLDFNTFYTRFEVSLAHIDQVGPAQMMDGEQRIVERITDFKFDNQAHFSAAKFDQVWLFGSAVNFFRGPGYPTDQLSQAELKILFEFMQGGGGLFATGDHGNLGFALCNAVPRARKMRYWDHTAAPNSAEDEVGMDGVRRNDTNRLGEDGLSQFDDQSDDIPQPLQPRYYRRRRLFFEVKFPHPLLCGRNGVIDVFPDHPHEGECIVPPDVSLAIDFGGGPEPEYPLSALGFRPVPEVIAWSSVLAGTSSGKTTSTEAHSFGAIAAYDGHRANVGRVVTDATWHHYVNINLIGNGGVGTKQNGFMSTTQGQGHFEKIKNYYTNIAVWLARPNIIRCMRNHWLWWLLMEDRVAEAVLVDGNAKMPRTSLATIADIGRHSRDALGRIAGHCQAWSFIFPFVEKALDPRLLHVFDVWSQQAKEKEDLEAFDLMDPSPLMDVALGGAIMALKGKFGSMDRMQLQKVELESVFEVATEGAQKTLSRTIPSLERAAELMRVSVRTQ